MRRALLIAMCLGGCFYTEPLNQRPSIDIVQQSSATVHRGDTVDLTSKGNDPDGGAVFFQWRAYACSDASLGVGNEAGCDQVPFRTEVLPTFSFDVPHVRANGMPVESLLVLLDGKDELDATAKPTQQLIIPVADEGPTLSVSKAFHRAYVAGLPVNVFAAVGDPDDGITPPPALTWTVFSPLTQPPYTLVDIPNVPADPDHPELAQFGKVFKPSDAGDWDIQVVATDAVGLTATKDIPITVQLDQPPCITEVAPIVPPMGETLPLDQTTLFQVLVVDDDLDVYPPSTDPITGVTAFKWSLLPPGATAWQDLTTATGNRVQLDPTTYAPGDIVELRVEIQDRNRLPVNCPDSQSTCGPPTCIQRQTWQVEVR